MDFSPMHPDVWANTDAERWNYYIQLRQAFEEGRDSIRDVRAEEREKKRKAEELERKQKEFIKKHSG